MRTAFPPFLWYKTLAFIGGSAFLISLMASAPAVRRYQIPIFALGLFLIGIAAWKRAEGRLVRNPGQEQEREEPAVRPARSRADWIGVALTLLGAFFLAVGAVRAAAPDRFLPWPFFTDSTNTPTAFVPNTCRIAMFTFEGDVSGAIYSQGEGRIANRLRAAGNVIMPFGGMEFNSLPSFFADNFDIVIIIGLGDPAVVPDVLASGLPVMIVDAEFADEFGLAEHPGESNKLIVSVEVVNNSHPITDGFAKGRFEAQIPVGSISIDSHLSDVEPLVVHESPANTLLAVNRSRPYVWFGLYPMPEESQFAFEYKLLDRTVSWLCGQRPNSDLLPPDIRMITRTDSPTPTFTASGTPEPSRSQTPTQSPIPTVDLFATPSPTSTPVQIPAVTATPVRNHLPGRVFSDPVCGFSFEYPVNWILEPARADFAKDNPCLFGMKPKNFDAYVSQADYCVSEYALYVWPMDGSFWGAALAQDFFYKNGLWYTEGWNLSARVVRARNLDILRGKFVMERANKDCSSGPYRVLADKAVINAGKDRSLVLVEDSIAFQLHFEYILQTISFLE